MKKKFLFSVVIAVLWVLLIVMIVHSFIKPQVVRWDYHAVDTGDTLWKIAEEHNPDYTGDIREITYQIKKANGMKDSVVYVGQVLEVPVMES
ncbi:MAG: LysM peptidoglycan-binding domain-containing protein [Clostridia bacterium]